MIGGNLVEMSLLDAINVNIPLILFFTLKDSGVAFHVLIVDGLQLTVHIVTRMLLEIWKELNTLLVINVKINRGLRFYQRRALICKIFY
ncbi:hypothetical protein RC92_06730 [Pectobacterium brasiliense]|nr:hypothetical protein RC79_06785 [Pectobacterium brasiliense]KHT09808.1 hypothetical protein RC92_06730 [Pectobacterium brasiliense]